MINKSLLTNLLAALLAAAGYFLAQPLLLSAGLFAFSGALTNWLAVYMLFERVPGLVGSGVVPNRFEEFKEGIRKLLIEQFFTRENIERLIEGGDRSPLHLDLAPLLEKLDLAPAFDALLAAIRSTSLGGMLGLVGGESMLDSLKPAFVAHMRQALLDITASPDFQHQLRRVVEQSIDSDELGEQIERIIARRLDELSPQTVKQIVQQMIARHLGWLVVWGGVFGGLIGLVAGLLQR